MKKWQIPEGTRDSLSPLSPRCCVSASLWSDANTLVMENADASFPTMTTNTSKISIWDREALSLSTSGSAAPLRSFLQVVVTIHTPQLVCLGHT